LPGHASTSTHTGAGSNTTTGATSAANTSAANTSASHAG